MSNNPNPKKGPGDRPEPAFDLSAAIAKGITALRANGVVDPIHVAIQMNGGRPEVHMNGSVVVAPANAVPS